MYKLFICSLIFSGIIFMLLGIRKFRGNIRLIREFHITDDLVKSDSLAFHQALLFLFLFGYILVLILYIFNINFASELITGLIFFFGSVFVFIENNLHKNNVFSLKKAYDKTIQISDKLEKERKKLLSVNSRLKSKMDDLRKSESQRRNLEARLQQAQKMVAIGTLAGGIAHDFNNILSPIVGHSELFLMDAPKNNAFRGSIQEIHTSALRAKRLVQQILTFSRQENSELQFMKIQPVVKEALKLMRSTIPTSIDIRQEIDADCGIIKADATQIHQIIMNLATNAFHAMEDKGGELSVRLREILSDDIERPTPDIAKGPYACLTIADTGVGMDKNLVKKIFDPFFTTKEQGKGTGMGLSVVYGIVSKMGGTIRIFSEPGKGSEFNVYFPLKKPSVDKQVPVSKARLQGGSEHILLVDDEEVVLKTEKQMLERMGYQVTSYSSSLEALEAFRSHPDEFDLIITDMSMPRMTGEKLAREMIRIQSDIPVLLCTGHSETISEEKAAGLGIKSFLLKPIAMNVLSEKIRELLVKTPK